MQKSSPYKYKLLIAYQGTRYSGWQVQPNATSIQFLIEEAMFTVLRKNTHVTGSGRTDRGVHALEQVAHFSTDTDIDTDKLSFSLNGLLPLDIRILSIETAAPDFHARYSATGKIYHYYILEKGVQNPFKHHYATPLSYPLDHQILKKAAHYFIGKHDFTSFSNEAHKGSASRNAVRTLKRLDIFKREGEIVLEFEADGFLYKMVRNIVGTLLDVARGKIPLDDIPHIFEAKDRKKAGSCAPPQGLFLVKIHYP